MTQPIACDVCGQDISAFDFPEMVAEMAHDWIGDGVVRDAKDRHQHKGALVNHGNLIRVQDTGTVVHACGSFSDLAP